MTSVQPCVRAVRLCVPGPVGCRLPHSRSSHLQRQQARALLHARCQVLQQAAARAAALLPAAQAALRDARRVHACISACMHPCAHVYRSCSGCLKQASAPRAMGIGTLRAWKHDLLPSQPIVTTEMW